MEGCIKEGAEPLSEDRDENVLDLGLIGAGSRVQHHAMAGYLTAISLSERIGEKQVVTLLKRSLAEEMSAEEAAAHRRRRTAGNHHAPLRAGQHHADLEPPGGRLGQTAGGRGRRERHARSATAPRPRAQVRSTKLQNQTGRAGRLKRLLVLHRGRNS
jgi:hypothetical protein